MIVLAGWSGGGCVEIPILLGLGEQRPGNGSTPSNGDDLPSNGGGSTVGPRATLSASTLAPAVGEEVILTCRTAGDPTGTVTFGFQTTTAALNVNALAGTARLVVSESDANVEIPVTCRATDDSGTGPVSNRVVILPFSSLPPEEPSQP